MSGENFGIIIPLIISLLIIWLVYRIRKRVEFIVKNEIYKNFPSIKSVIDNFQRRVDYLKTSIEELERRITQLERKTK
jgi:hypothetical protein